LLERNESDRPAKSKSQPVSLSVPELNDDAPNH
jgi:hypothetical protein